MYRIPALTLVAMLFAAQTSAHHGFGSFDRSKEIEVEGTVIDLDFVNPHSYVNFNSVGPDGAVIEMRCEMRAANVLRRSGWSRDMFPAGVHIVITGRPHRDDPSSCYAETLAIGDAPTLARYDQLDEATGTERVDRALRLPSGVINLSGDWAQEQYLIARPPDGGRGGLVPKSMVAAVTAGDLAFSDVPGAGWGARPVNLTEAGVAAADALRNAPPEANPRLRCEITSVLFDWVFDGPINRIAQSENAITLEYGRGLTRTVNMDTDHPSGITPSLSGHSIGHWDGDTLVVDTVGFVPGSLAWPVPHSDELHVVERFMLDPETMALKRDYVAEDPVYYTDNYVGSDTVLPADVPFAVDQCKELAYEYRSVEEDAAP